MHCEFSDRYPQIAKKTASLVLLLMYSFLFLLIAL